MLVRSYTNLADNNLKVMKSTWGCELEITEVIQLINSNILYVGMSLILREARFALLILIVLQVQIKLSNQLPVQDILNHKHLNLLGKKWIYTFVWGGACPLYPLDLRTQLLIDVHVHYIVIWSVYMLQNIEVILLSTNIDGAHYDHFVA